MKELEKGDRFSKSLLANVLDMDDDYISRLNLQECYVPKHPSHAYILPQPFDKDNAIKEEIYRGIDASIRVGQNPQEPSEYKYDPILQESTGMNDEYGLLHVIFQNITFNQVFVLLLQALMGTIVCKILPPH